ncbi:hypothetical protein BCT78_04610 [Vibrio breoganii]|uniref:glycosyltransferase n=1 Tax=Vibrio breoganii TaxID=553239 RepID=UPI000C824972|nr:glycosyltransferase [Vibrio breoganii]PML38973.1 hypothetical protein BCT78_04610 [Vibrio breoganii]
MNISPLISVVVPIYNMEHYISQCLDSFLKQTYRNLEIILVDDGSTDNTLDLLKKFAFIDDRFNVFSIPNKGVSNARNFGIAKCNGDYISFVDPDDWLEPHFYELMLSSAVKNNSDIVKCGIKFCNESGVVKTRYSKDQKITPLDAVREILSTSTNNYSVVCWDKIYKRKILDNINFHPNLTRGEDLPFSIEVALNSTSISLVNHTLYNYRLRDGGYSRSYSDSHLRSTLSALTIIKNLLVNHDVYNFVHRNYIGRTTFLCQEELKKIFYFYEGPNKLDKAIEVRRYIMDTFGYNKLNYCAYLTYSKLPISKKLYCFASFLNVRFANFIFQRLYK